ncbi:MAG: ADP-ribosylglycohydrolase family protein [Desulfovibrionaceae bacterium]|nr:ADP-ribosylglycohydrolase family protein [Desulfovibrionaceae bacterium]
MYGALIGDVAGSRHEFDPLPKSARPEDFTFLTGRCRPTDDSMMTLAVARAIRLTDGDFEGLAETLIDAMHDIGNRYINAGYGGTFIHWLLQRSRAPYNSFGNGSAMRVSPAGWAWSTLEDTQKGAAITASVSHNHPYGITGAKATASAIFMARTGAAKAEIREYIEREFGYDLSRPLADIQPWYSFDVTCQGSVPEALTAFLEGGSYEEAVRRAIWLGGDSDTQGCIAGGVAEAMYGVPEDIKQKGLTFFDDYQRREIDLWAAWLAKRQAAGRA